MGSRRNGRRWARRNEQDVYGPEEPRGLPPVGACQEDKKLRGAHPPSWQARSLALGQGAWPVQQRAPLLGGVKWERPAYHPAPRSPVHGCQRAPHRVLLVALPSF